MPDRAVGLLGPTVIFVDGEAIDPGGRRIRRVLASLAVRAPDPVRTDRLIDDVWGDAAPARARASLQMHITKLRRLLEPTPARVETVAEGYRLVVPVDGVDAARFERLVEAARTARGEGRWDTALERATSATALWRGDELIELEEMASVAGERSRLLELRRHARIIRAEALLALGRPGDAVGELERIVVDEPFVERFWELLMLALYRSGRQADALAAFRQAASILGEELGIEPGPALQRLEEQILLHDPALEPDEAPKLETPTLPAPRATFVGRGAEIGWVTDRLHPGGIVTIVGPGGVGKTSLALVAGRRVEGRYGDGAAFVDLTQATRDGVVAAVVAEHLGLDTGGDPSAAVVEHLRSRSMLLVVDNCEHVFVGARRFLDALTASCPDVAVIATSRRRLDLAVETWLTLESLAIPPPGLAAEEVAAYDSVQMFLDRAAAAAPGLVVSDDDLDAVADICRKLDGLPLALELVAAWMSVLTIADVVARIDDAGLLQARHAEAGDRHASLGTTIEWSYRLLDRRLRDAFEMLAVFRSGFGVGGAAAVLDVDPDDAIALLARLVDHSLLVADVTGPHARFSMLDMIRAFARERLADRPDVDAVEDRYRRRVIRTVVEAGDGDEAAWFDDLQARLADVRAVLEWAEAEEPETVVELAERLRPFWAQRGLGAEIEPRLVAAIQHRPSPGAWYTLGVMRYARGALEEAREAFAAGLASEPDGLDRARLVNALGVVSLDEGCYEEAYHRYREAESLFADAAHDSGVAAAVLNQGIVEVNLGRLDSAAESFESAREMFRRLGDRREEAHALLRLAFVAELGGRTELARERAQAALRIVRPLGHALAVADALQYTAEFELGAGSVVDARALLREAVGEFGRLGNVLGLARSFLTAAGIAVHDEQWPEAAEMCAYAAALRAELGIPIPAANRDAVTEITRLVEDVVPLVRREALAERARLSDLDGMVERCLDVLGVA